MISKVCKQIQVVLFDTPAGTVDNFIVHSGISPKSAWVLSKVHTLYRTWEEANKALIEYNKVFTTFRAS